VQGCKDWERVGYVVTETLPDVNRAMDQKNILKVYFDWIKFKMYKAPGLYPGIIVILNETWSRTIVQSISSNQL